MPRKMNVTIHKHFELRRENPVVYCGLFLEFYPQFLTTWIEGENLHAD